MNAANDIAEFLASRRAKISPEQAGLPSYGQRRVPGLRREEVASLAGVSADYYRRLERGQLSGVSELVLDALARALQLDDAERSHLFDLARAVNPIAPRRVRPPRTRIRPVMQRLLDQIEAPAVVTSVHQDLLAANGLGRALYAPVFDSPELPANIARFAFRASPATMGSDGERRRAPAAPLGGTRVYARAAMNVEVRDVVPGLWLWRQPHPSWSEGADWPAEVASFAVRSRDSALLLDPLAPPPSAREVWDRIEALAPETVVVLKPDHVRDVDLFVRWYGVAAYGPQLFWRDDVPETELRALHPGDELPGGLIACHDGRGVLETPLYLPEQRALVFADALAAPEGELRVWSTPWHEERTLPALRALLELDFEHVLVSHGEPVHDRDDFAAALEREPWSSWHGA